MHLVGDFHPGKRGADLRTGKLPELLSRRRVSPDENNRREDDECPCHGARVHRGLLSANRCWTETPTHIGSSWAAIEDQLLVIAAFSSAARSPRASFSAFSLAQKCRYLGAFGYLW